jgi:hypothetical protein
MSRSRHNDPFHGWYQTLDEADARQLAEQKRREGLRVRLTTKPLTQGHQIYPHRVAWWTPEK